jgi:hypothetical protein
MARHQQGGNGRHPFESGTPKETYRGSRRRVESLRLRTHTPRGVVWLVLFGVMAVVVLVFAIIRGAH